MQGSKKTTFIGKLRACGLRKWTSPEFFQTSPDFFQTIPGLSVSSFSSLLISKHHVTGLKLDCKIRGARNWFWQARISSPHPTPQFLEPCYGYIILKTRLVMSWIMLCMLEVNLLSKILTRFHCRWICLSKFIRLTLCCTFPSLQVKTELVAPCLWNYIFTVTMVSW